MTAYTDTHEPPVPALPPHTVKWVFDPDGIASPFAYTVGLAARPDHAYELATTGLPDRLAHAVITAAAEQLATGHLDPADGLELDQVLQGDYTVRLRRAADTTQCTGARAAHGDDVAVWQILTPDPRNLFPGDPDYAETIAQPLM